jgi:hypothetical protein
VDFIVLGSILGAILIAAGRACVELVPWRLPAPSDDQEWLEVRDRRRLVRLLRAGGRMLVVVGVVLLLTTGVLVVMGASDRVALTTVLIVGIGGMLAAAGLLGWYRYQDSTGAIQRRQLRAIRSRLGSTQPGNARRHDEQAGRTARAEGQRDPDERGQRRAVGGRRSERATRRVASPERELPDARLSRDPERGPEPRQDALPRPRMANAVRSETGDRTGPLPAARRAPGSDRPSSARRPTGSYEPVRRVDDAPPAGIAPRRPAMERHQGR